MNVYIIQLLATFVAVTPVGRVRIDTGVTRVYGGLRESGEMGEGGRRRKGGRGPLTQSKCWVILLKLGKKKSHLAERENPS